MATFAFTLVGMRFVAADTGSKPVTISDVEDCSYMALFTDPSNPHDKNAIEVRGLLSDGFRKIGYVSRDSQPKPGSGLPHFGTDGTIYEVYDTWSSNGPMSLAVQVRLAVDKPTNFTHICADCYGCSAYLCEDCKDVCERGGCLKYEKVVNNSE